MESRESGGLLVLPHRDLVSKSERRAPDCLLCQGTERNTAAAPLERCTQLLLPTNTNLPAKLLGAKGKVKEPRGAIYLYEKRRRPLTFRSRVFCWMCVCVWLGLLFAVQFVDVFGARSRVQGGVRSGLGFLPSSTRVYLTEYLAHWSLEVMISLCSDGNTQIVLFLKLT